MVPFWVNEMNEYITPDPNSNPILYYVKWYVIGNDGEGPGNNKETTNIVSGLA